MQTGFRGKARRWLLRFYNRYLLLSFSTLLLAQAAVAEQTAPGNPSIVLVLKLVSTTHVTPVTGIVVSDQGLVLVPADFVTAAAEIVVLDGGTDILRHGRPATIVNPSVTGGLALLSVEGLKRPGITLSDNAKGAASDLHLAAFPPAEYIAKGAQPLWIAVKVLQDNFKMRALISPETPLPYVSGALIDDCGYLAGLSLTSGAQSLETANSPVTLLNDQLDRVFASMQIDIARARCVNPVQQVERPAMTQDQGNTSINNFNAEESDLESTRTELPDAEKEASVIDDPALETDPVTTVDRSKLTAVNTPSEAPSRWLSMPFWLLLVAIIILAVLIWIAVTLVRAKTQTTDLHPSASNEPDTAPLQADSGQSTTKTRSKPLDVSEIPDMDTLPAGCNGLLVIEGLLSTDTPFKRFCAVNTAQFVIVIGRGDADICIDHPAISRAHARLESDAESMTLSDLGSSNGTFIRGVPCLHGEIMFVDAEDEIYLGDVRFQISVIKHQTDLT